MICVQNEKSMDFDIPKTAIKNILVYGIFNKEDWEQEAKRCDYRYFDQILENQKNKIQSE